VLIKKINRNVKEETRKYYKNRKSADNKRVTDLVFLKVTIQQRIQKSTPGDTLFYTFIHA
jgi:hypothetical protein